MGNFLERQQEQKAAALKMAKATYLKLIAKAGDAGDLSDADGAKLLDAAQTLGVSVDVVAADLAIAKERIRLRPIAAEIDARTAELKAANAGALQYKEETEKVLEELKAKRREEGAKLDQRIDLAHSRLTEATDARAKIAEIERAHFAIFNIEDPSLAVFRRHLVDVPPDAAPTNAQYEVTTLWDLMNNVNAQQVERLLSREWIALPGQNQSQIQALLATAQRILGAFKRGRRPIFLAADNQRTAAAAYRSHAVVISDLLRDPPNPNAFVFIPFGKASDDDVKAMVMKLWRRRERYCQQTGRDFVMPIDDIEYGGPEEEAA